MRIGIWIDDHGADVEEVAERARLAADHGYEAIWLSERSGWEPLTLLTVIAGHVPDVRLGTSIVRSHPRHPLVLAAQAATVQAATGGRLVLGVGPSHASIIEGQYGLSYAHPVRHTREYLTALQPLLRGDPVDLAGAALTVSGQLAMAGTPTPPPVYLSALGPRMLRLAGELADGVVTTWTGPRSIAERIRPALVEAADAAARLRPAIVAGTCVAVTTDPDGARDWVERHFGPAGELPNYRRQFDREGARSPADLVIAGDEETVHEEFRRLADAGADEVQVLPVGPEADRARTVEVAARFAR